MTSESLSRTRSTKRVSRILSVTPAVSRRLPADRRWRTGRNAQTITIPADGGFAKRRAQIQHKAGEKGILIETLTLFNGCVESPSSGSFNPSKECYAYSKIGHRPQQPTFKCTNDDCWMNKYHE